VNPEAGGFGPEHLPYGVFARAGEPARVGARLDEGVLDLAALARDGLLDADPELFAQPSLNAFMAAGPQTWAAVRGRLTELARGVDAEAPRLALDDVRLRLPFAVADYVDFYSSLEHATNLGRLFRPGSEPLLPNWRHLPVGYHGRAGTVVVSGTDVRRPHGQRMPPDADAPVHGPSARLDVELELGVVVGVPSALGEPVPVASALDHVFGLVLVNDWSARDLQAWEYQPLGPFLGKSFATSIGAWVTPLAAVAGRRVAAPAQEPAPLPYLREAPWAFDLELEIELNGTRVAATNARHLYWSFAQQIAHLTANGASLRTGDLLASGTISGPGRGERGSLIELTWNGAEPLELPGGGPRTFLEDGDEVVLRGRGGERVALAEVRGRIVP
jgi:fumarylacetoacetase